MSLCCHSCESGIFIVTENVDGEVYILESFDLQEIIEDWKGDCNFVPANDAKVFFASYFGKPINPYMYTDFQSLLRYLRAEYIRERER